MPAILYAARFDGKGGVSPLADHQTAPARSTMSWSQFGEF